MYIGEMQFCLVMIDSVDKCFGNSKMIKKPSGFGFTGQCFVSEWDNFLLFASPMQSQVFYYHSWEAHFSANDFRLCSDMLFVTSYSPIQQLH